MQSDMKLISVNVGLPRIVMSHGDPVSTGIFKAPVANRVMLRTLNLDGDRRLIFPCTVDPARRFTSIRPNITTTGNTNSLR